MAESVTETREEFLTRRLAERGEELERMREALNYVADMTRIGSDGEWHFKQGYDPQAVLNALGL